MWTVLSRPSRQARQPLTSCLVSTAVSASAERSPKANSAGQPGAMPVLPKARNFRTPYCDTVQNGSALGKSVTYDPQLDTKALLPTHTFCGLSESRKSPKRPALPGAVISGRCRSLAPTLSPALFSHLPPLLGFGRYVMVIGGLRANPRARFFLFHLRHFLVACLTPPPTGEGPGFVYLGFSPGEKPSAFPQEKTGASYPRGSRGMSRRFIPLTNGSHRSNGAFLELRWCPFSYSALKTAYGVTQGRVWVYRFFPVRSCSGRAEKSCSSMQFTASWMGQF